MNIGKPMSAVSIWLVTAFVVLLLDDANAVAESSQLPEPLKTAVEKLASQASEGWAYTRETRDDIGHYVERFDPTLPRDQQWQLVFFNGEAPTDKHRKRYQKEYDNLFERDSPTDTNIARILDAATLVLEADDGETLHYSFQPAADGMEDAKIVANLIGKIVIHSDSNEVSLIEIRNKDAFSPVALVSIRSMFMRLEFDDVTKQGPRFVHRAQSATEGRYMGLKKFAESEDVVFSNFRQP